MVVDEYKSKFESGKMITISKHDERLENTLNVCGTWSWGQQRVIHILGPLLKLCDFPTYSIFLHKHLQLICLYIWS